jgi:hypothetical protein
MAFPAGTNTYLNCTGGGVMDPFVMTWQDDVSAYTGNAVGGWVGTYAGLFMVATNDEDQGPGTGSVWVGSIASGAATADFCQIDLYFTDIDANKANALNTDWQGASPDFGNSDTPAWTSAAFSDTAAEATPAATKPPSNIPTILLLMFSK